LGEPLLQLGAMLFEVLQHSLDGRNSQRVANECAGEECDPNFRVRIVAKLPCSAIERIHEPALAGKNADGHATSENFSVSGQISADSKQRLATAWMNAEPGDYFVKNERCVGPGSNFTQFLEKLYWLEIRMSALHRLEKNRGKVLGILTYPGERFRRTVI
jgi:hypothetical protein